MGVVHNGEPVTTKAKVLTLIKTSQNLEIMSWSGGNVLFYFDTDTGDVVYPHDITYAYLIDEDPTTALELIKKAKSNGFKGNDTSRAAAFMRTKGSKVKNNPNPTPKFTGLKSH